MNEEKKFMQHSKALDELAVSKAAAGCFSKISKAAMFKMQGKGFGTVIDVVEAFTREGLLVNDAEITCVTIRREFNIFTLLFSGSVNDVSDLIRAIQPPKRGKTAPSVLEKMALKRIDSVQKLIEKCRSNYHVQVRLLACRLSVPDVTLDDVKDPDRLTRWFAHRLPNVSDARRRPIYEMKKFINRDDVTEDIIHAAWNLFEIRKVQES